VNLIFLTVAMLPGSVAWAAPATHFSVAAPTPATAGNGYVITITALDASNNVDNTYTGAVHFTSTDPSASLPANYTFTPGDNGVHTFTGVTLRTAGNQTITATDTLSTSINGTSNNIVVISNSATHFTVSAPAPAISGTAFNATVTALDQFNNVATGYTGTVHFVSTDGSATLPSDYTFTGADSGVHTFTGVTLRSVGTTTITATDTTSPAITGSSTIPVNPAPAATHFSVTAPATATAGTAFSVTVTALDPSNNVVPGYTGTVHFTSTDGAATVPANYTFTGADNGVHTFSVTLFTGGNQTVTATDTVTASINGTSGTITVSGAKTTIVVSSSLNPSNAGQPVTFTATASSSGGTPTGGTVTFSDGAQVIGSAALTSGIATFTTSLLTVGNHSISANFGGTASFAASASAALLQVVNVPLDSQRLRAMQVLTTPLVAQVSGQAISGAVDSALGDGFSDGGLQPATPTGNGLRFNFTADTDAPPDKSAPIAFDPTARGGSFAPTSRDPGSPATPSRIDDAFSALAYAMPTKAPPRIAPPKDWLVWAEVRGAVLDRWTAAGAVPGATTLYGNQVNVIAGISRKFTPNFLVGVLGGVETFDYRSDALTGRLKGDGWTVGGYLGWKLTPSVRYDASVAYSSIGYDGSAGLASGSFPGQRWLASTGLTGTYDAFGFMLEPSARVYALWEHENAYTDSLGALQSARDFSTGRASGGLKVTYPFAWTSSATLAPYAGLYGDYYFKTDNAGVPVPGLLPAAIIQNGWSARAVGGIGARFDNGAQIAIGGERGGIGSSFGLWTYRARVSVPFSAQ
jgi:hypothetical protein